MWRYNIILLIVFGGCCQGLAQNVVFTAEAGANKIGTKDQVQIQYTIRDAQNLQSVSRPATSDFVITQGPFQSQSTNMSISGNKMVQSQAVTLTYVIQPKHEGTFTIPPIVAKDAAGHSFQSNAITIQVIPGTVQQRPSRNDPFGGQDEDMMAMMQHMQQMQQQQMQAIQQMQQRRQQPQQQQQQQTPQQIQQQQQQETAANEEEIKKNLFIKVVVDKSKVHVGEQITTSYKLYSRLPMQVGISKLPSLNGFWTQDFDIPKQAKPTEEILDGKKYQVFLLKKSALFPQQASTLELDAAEAKGVARIVQQVKRKLSDMFADPFGGGSLMMNDPFFNNNFFNSVQYKDVQVNIKSAPVKITVTALPDKNRPAGYGGAVGSFAINDKIDKQDITTDDVATLTVNITGSGNLKLIEAPKPDLPNGLNTYDPVITDTITGRSTTISGTKIISYAITPHTPGDYDIPGIAFSCFNPQTGEYVTQHTQPIKLHVRPGKHYAPTQAGNNNLALKDIHDIVKEPLLKLIPQSKPLLYTGTYWSMFAFPLLAFVGLIAWKRRDEELAKDTVLLRSRRANKIALQRLVTAKKLLQQNEKKPFYEEISKAIWLYLSDKLNIPLSSLSHESAKEALLSRNVPQHVQKNMDNVIWECETSLYASGGSKQMSHTYEEAIKVISDLEDVFRA